MERTCVKCKYERDASDNITPEYECPKCGAIYMKARATFDVSTQVKLSDKDNPKEQQLAHEKIKKLQDKVNFKREVCNVTEENDQGAIKTSLLEHVITWSIFFIIIVFVINFMRGCSLPTLKGTSTQTTYQKCVEVGISLSVQLGGYPSSRDINRLEIDCRHMISIENNPM